MDALVVALPLSLKVEFDLQRLLVIKDLAQIKLNAIQRFLFLHSCTKVVGKLYT